jgi:L-rhamnonate dehydratase
MTVKTIRTRVYRWVGPTSPPRRNLSASPMDAVVGLGDSMSAFRFHEWMICEIETSDGHVGLGNCALAPAIAKSIIDTYLAPLVIGRDPFDGRCQSKFSGCPGCVNLGA